MRSPDGSADLYQLLAGLAVACRYGFEIPDALDIAEKTYVNVNIHQEENIIKKLVSYNDTTLREDLKNDPEGMLELVNRYFHCG